MRKEECFLLGKISRKHSFRGEVVARFDADTPSKYENLESIFLLQKGELVPFFIESLTILPKGVRIKFEDIDDEQSAQQLVGRELYLHESMLPPPSEGQIFLHDIEGYAVIDKHHGAIGILQAVIEGKQDVLEVLHPNGVIIYIPWVDKVIVTNINRDEKVIEVDCPEGLVELYLT